MSVPNVYVSPVLRMNPFAFVYASYRPALRLYVDPAVTAAVLTDPDWQAKTEELQLRWFSVQNNLGDLGDNPVEWKTLIAAIVLFTLPILCSVLNGDVGPGIFKDVPPESWRGRVRKMIEKPTEKEDKAFMDEREGALQGHDLSFFRFAVHQLEGLTSRVQAVYPEQPSAASSGSGLGRGEAVMLLAEVKAMLEPLMEDVRSLKSQLAVKVR
jgi:hypothetical protein